ncbi:MAG: M1 family peptidase, partial [Roseivirga sp.]|nr:M1 family peptidase [Roseivirga sp.]
MKSTLSIFLMLLAFTATSQTGWQGKFEQMGNMLPTPNQYRTGSGEPGPSYWQQKADYKIKLELDDENQKITGSEVVTYYNNSPSALRYLWVQLDQNVRQKDNLSSLTSGTRGIPDNVTSLRTTQAQSALGDTGFDGGFKLMAVKDTKGNDLDYVVNFTMMKINLPEPLESGDSFSFNIDWWYNINDRGLIGG